MIGQRLLVATVQREIFTRFHDWFTFAEPLEISQNELCSLLKQDIIVAFPSLIDVVSLDI